MILKTVAITEKYSNLEEVASLAKEAFPPEEYLPPETLIEMSKGQDMDFWALHDGGRFVGFMAVKTRNTMAYLFFLAIMPPLRSSGYGGRAIETLKALYPSMQQVVDLEMIDDTAANNEQRKSRRSFYLRHGYQATGQFLSYYGVDYEVLCMDSRFDLNTFQELMDSLPLKDFHPIWFTR